MSSIKKNIAGKKFTARKGLKVGIVQSEYNQVVSEALLKSCKRTLLESGVSEKKIQLVNYPLLFVLYNSLTTCIL